jgi:Uma2 family endonuclease
MPRSIPRSSTAFRRPPGYSSPTAPEPDVAAYQGFPLELPIEEWNWRDVSPILVAEILSEDSADKDLVRNRRLYLQVPSIREYWILDPRQDPDHPSLLVYRRSGQRWARVRTVPPYRVARRAARRLRGLSLHGGCVQRGTSTTPLLPGFTLEVAPHP